MPLISLAGTKRKVGRHSVIEAHPEIVEIVRDFITQHSSSAHDRRRDDVQYSHGVTLAAIRSHVLREIPALKKISVHTIHRLLLPPNKNRNASKRYKSLVEAKRPPKRNDLTSKIHADFHYSSAQVNFVGELAELFSDETIAISADDKNKVNVGTLAVSRHFSINNIFATNDQPNYPDHDFPYTNAKIVPAGYLVLKSRNRRSRSLSPRKTNPKKKRRSLSAPPNNFSYRCYSKDKIFIDTLGRERIRWPRSGSLNVLLYPSMFFESTSAMHVFNLKKILQPIVSKEGKKAVTIICDGGPDWSPKSTPNLINFGRLWRDLNLDILILTSYAPGHSRYNPIERSWAPLSRWLTGVTLPISLEGKTSPWVDFAGQSENEIRNRKAEVLDEACRKCSKYWDGKKIDSFPVRVTCIESRSQEAQISDHELLKALANSSEKKIKSDPNMENCRSEYQFLMGHLTRKTYQIEFVKCVSSQCDHCAKTPIRAVNFFNFIKQHGGVVPFPESSTVYRGHYSTLLQHIKMPLVRDFEECLPSLKGASQPACPKDNCRYVFNSKADEKRHNILMSHKNK